MARGDTHRDEDMALVRQYLSGDTLAMQPLQDAYHTLLVGILQKRGATVTEAEDLVADMWGECVAREDRPSLLEKFSGRCALRTWLIAVATNRLLDVKRRAQFRSEHAADSANPLDRLPDATLSSPEETLTNLLRDSLKHAFTQCPADKLLMLRLVHMHGLTQREAGQLWGWHESKVSRMLSDTMNSIATHTLNTVRRKDAWLQLGWQDFLDLCQTRQVGFL